jgi:hypothetical protein
MEENIKGKRMSIEVLNKTGKNGGEKMEKENMENERRNIRRRRRENQGRR